MKLFKKDWENIVKGASVLATGGGGDLKEAKEIFSGVFAKKRSIELTGFDSLDPEKIICTAYIAGSIAGFERSAEPLFLAFKILEKTIKSRISGILPVEIGPGDIAETVNISSELNIPVVDADIVGKRSSPEIFLETISLGNIKRTPLVMVNTKNRVRILTDDLDPYEIEKEVRAFARNSGGDAFIAGYPNKASDLQKFVGKNTLSLSRKIGEIISLKSRDPANELAEITGGKILFEGIMERAALSDDLGFLSGKIKFSGINNFSGKRAVIYIKNENLILWIDKKLKLTCPDLICLIDPDTGLGIYNRDLKIGKNVFILGIRSLDIWRSKKGQELFNPGLFGYKFKPKLLE